MRRPYWRRNPPALHALRRGSGQASPFGKGGLRGIFRHSSHPRSGPLWVRRSSHFQTDAVPRAGARLGHSGASRHHAPEPAQLLLVFVAQTRYPGPIFCKEQHMTIDQHNDLEAIRQLKARYFRLMDTQQWDLLRECFAADISALVRRRAARQRGATARHRDRGSQRAG